MKKIIFVLLLAVILFPVSVFAKQQQRAHDMGTGITNSEIREVVVPIQQDRVLQNKNQVVNQKSSQKQKRVGDGSAEPMLVNEQLLDSKKQVKNQNRANAEIGEARRSRVAQAVQEMLKVATRNKGVGQQIRTVAQNQNKDIEETEEALQKAKKRRGFARFFIGPNYREIKTAKEKLKNHAQHLEELKVLKESLTSSDDKNLLDEQIQVMEEIKTELETDIKQNTRGFSLFGWLNKILIK